MAAQPLEPARPHDPGEDPAVIFDALPPSHRAQFRTEYDEALEAAHDLARFEQVQALLRQWRLRATAYSRAGYEEAVQDAVEGRSEMFTRYTGVGRPGVSHEFDGFHGRALYELNGLMVGVPSGFISSCCWTMLLRRPSPRLRPAGRMWEWLSSTAGSNA